MNKFLIRIAYISYFISYSKALPRFFWKLLRNPFSSTRLNGRKREFLGFVKPVDKAKPVIWIIGTSSADLNSSAIVIDQLVSKNPQVQFVISSRSTTGSEFIEDEFSGTVEINYAPLDLFVAVSRFLDRTHPAMLVLMNTGFWPVLFRECRKRRIPIYMFNASFNKKSIQRFCQIERLVLPTIRSLDLVACPLEGDRKQFIQQGLPSSSCLLMDSSKTDVLVTDSMKRKAKAFRSEFMLDSKFVVIAGSMEAGEAKVIEAAFSKVLMRRKDLLFLIVPRFPQFSKEYADSFDENFDVSVLSEHRLRSDKTNVIIVDKIGDLKWLYGVSDLAIIGGGFAKVGGHNLMEAAVWGKPVLTGPNLENVEGSRDRLLGAKGILIAEHADDLGSKIIDLIDHSEKCEIMGQNALSESLRSDQASQQIANKIISGYNEISQK